MLTFENILELFQEYLLRDPEVDVVVGSRYVEQGSIGDAVLVDVGPDVSGFRGKLASVFDCADGLGI